MLRLGSGQLADWCGAGRGRGLRIPAREIGPGEPAAAGMDRTDVQGWDRLRYQGVVLITSLMIHPLVKGSLCMKIEERQEKHDEKGSGCSSSRKFIVSLLLLLIL